MQNTLSHRGEAPQIVVVRAHVSHGGERAICESTSRELLYHTEFQQMKPIERERRTKFKQQQSNVITTTKTASQVVL
jgi:hypothetical protein